MSRVRQDFSDLVAWHTWTLSKTDLELSAALISG